MEPIGFTRTSLAESELRGNRRNIVSEIVINEQLEPALDGIEDYSHLIILFWMDRVSPEERKTLKVHPKHDGSLPLVGSLVVRQKSRPNPIGLAVVELLKKNGNTLTVKGLDALDGSPVLDIKSYDYSDRPEEIKVPAWWLLHRNKNI